jgi:hypothetical protein
MAETEFLYKGKRIVIGEGHPDVTVTVDGREFRCHHHHPEGDQGLVMWMCDETYFASPDIRELARHFADYGYLFDAPGRVVVDEAGDVVRVGGKPPDDQEHPHDGDHDHGDQDNGGNQNGGGQ